MRLRKAFATPRAWFLTGLVFLFVVLPQVQAEDFKLEAQLVWGTSDAKSPDPKHKPVEAAILKKLKELPLKWTNYFEVTRKQFELTSKETKKFDLGKCEIEVRQLANSDVEVSLYGKNGEKVVKRTQAFPKGEILVLGGNAPNATAWLVILKRI